VTESGGTVTAWADQSGNGSNFSEASNGPGYSASHADWSGLPALTFAGTAADTLVSVLGASAWGFINQGAGATILMVFRFDADADDYLLSSTSLASSTGFLLRRTASNDRMALQVGAPAFIVHTNSGNDTYPGGSRRMHMIRLQDAASPEVELYDASGSLGTTSHGTPDAGNPAQTARISGRAAAAGSNPFTGTLVKVALWNKQVSGAEASTLIAQCVADWSL
jgi:hypothetical protein